MDSWRKFNYGKKIFRRGWNSNCRFSFCGYNSPTSTEEYNGTSWTAGGNLGTGRYSLAGCGIQTAGLAFGGNVSPKQQTEEYDGSSWTAGGNLGTARYLLAGAGTQTAGLAFGGTTGSTTASTELYDGSSWTSSTNMITGKSRLGGAGTQAAGLAFNGTLPPGTITNQTEEFTGAGPVTVTLSGS